MTYASTPANPKLYRSIVPLPLTEAAAQVLGSQWPVDEQLFLWLVREGFEHQAENDGLEIVELRDLGNVPSQQVKPAGVQQLTEAGAAADDICWRAFEAVARRPAWSIWCEAEAVYEAGQQALAEGDEIA